MKKSVIFAIFFIYSANAEAQYGFSVQPDMQSCRQYKGELCKAPELSPAEKCRRAGGRYVNGLCMVTRRVVKRVVEKSPPEVKVVERVVEKPVERIVKVPVPAPPAPITITQEQKVVAPPQKKDDCPPAKLAVKKKDRWWWMGPGIFFLGLWAGEKDVTFGPYATLVFAINDRFRVGGGLGLGYSPWRDLGLLLNAYGAVRAYRSLYLDFGLETLWSEFDGLSVRRRFVAGSIGPEYWFGERASVSLRFLFGVHDIVNNCKDNSGKFSAGNLLTATMYW